MEGDNPVKEVRVNLSLKNGKQRQGEREGWMM